MEKNLISMAREFEKLRAEIGNAEKRARAAAAAGTQGAGFVANYGNPDPNFMVNPYAAVYGMNPVQGVADPNAQYGMGTYEMQGILALEKMQLRMVEILRHPRQGLYGFKSSSDNKIWVAVEIF
ncbi:protein FLX-like 1 [Carex littledalei]|uniref:Protein FLX-like 1 n=1 Tax=Carex littledalei TaxID=544730 RepID=A0A833V9S2_9POAL|nr:protein FLX-like 1 [Carex littledalei]